MGLCIDCPMLFAYTNCTATFEALIKYYITAGVLKVGLGHSRGRGATAAQLINVNMCRNFVGMSMIYMKFSRDLGQ